MLFFFQTEKVDLENTVVDESQRQFKEVGSSTGSTLDKSSGMLHQYILFIFGQDDWFEMLQSRFYLCFAYMIMWVT